MDIDFFRCDHTLVEVAECLNEIVKHKYRDTDAFQIFQALDIAYTAHEKQFRNDTVPFIIHPMRVALMLIHFERNITTRVVIAALLHDILEDTSVTRSMIEEKFGRYTAKLVQSVTRLHKSEGLEEKREAKRQNWEEIILEDHEVRAIKTFEDLDNMICWKTISSDNPVQNKIPRWLEEAQEMSLPLAHATNMQAYEIMQQECKYYVEKGYSNLPITI